MKLNKWLYGAAALAMLAACSDKDVAPGGGGENGTSSFTAGTSFLGITLELPSDLETRAEYGDDGPQGNDKFEDGEEWEYNVDNAALLLFKGPKTSEDNSIDIEAKAKFVGAYVVSGAEAFDQPNKDNITVSFQKAIKVLDRPEIGEDDQLWGLAIVNYKNDDHFTIISGEDPKTYGDLSIRTMDNAASDGTATGKVVTPVRLKNEKDGVSAATFEEIRGYITDCSFIKPTSNGKAIFMTNAPLSAVAGISNNPAGGNAKIQTLAKLNNNFKESETEAIQNPAGCIFVERALAKVTLSEFPKFAILTRTQVHNAATGAADYEDVTVKLPITSVQWAIDNDEELSYIIRNAVSSHDYWGLATNNYAGANRYRFVGNAGMNDYAYDTDPVHDKNGTTWFRTYWCVDPAYSTLKKFKDRTKEEGAFKNLITSTTNNNLYASQSPFYPHENTFSVDKQTYQNTTRVVFKVTYDTTGKIGTLNDSGEFVENAENATLSNCNLYAIRGQLRSFYLETDAYNLLMKSVLGSPSLHTLIKEYLGNASTINYGSDDVVIVTASAPKTEGEIVKGDYIADHVEFTPAFWKREDIKFNSLEDALADPTVKAKMDELLPKIASDANSDNHIVPFTNNSAYYVVYIQHFGDTYCPMPTKIENGVKVDAWKGEDTKVVYENNNAAKYLGRYGMVRNNWYDLQIGKIGSLGRATVPDGNVEISDDNKVEEWYLSARIHVLSWAKRTQHHDF